MNGSSNVGYDSDEGVDLPFHYSKCLYEWVVYNGLFVVGGVGKYVMAVDEFYDVWWGWCLGGGGRLSMGAPSIHKTPKPKFG